MEGIGVCMYGSLCVLSRGKGGGVLWNYSYSLNAERKALDRLRQPRIENVCTENTHAYTQICSDNSGPSAVTPASAAARTAVRNSPQQKPSQVALRCERTVADAVAGHKHNRRRRTCEFVCVTHHIGVLRVELCLHALLLSLHGCLAALAEGGPPLPLSACTHHSLSI